MDVDTWQAEGTGWEYEWRGIHAKWVEANQKIIQLKPYHIWCSQTDDTEPKPG
jgi:hypothetical protein